MVLLECPPYDIGTVDILFYVSERRGAVGPEIYRGRTAYE